MGHSDIGVTLNTYTHLGLEDAADELKRMEEMCIRDRVNLGQVPGTSLQSGIRPVVVVSNNKANTYSPVVTVVPFTSRVYKKR